MMIDDDRVVGRHSNHGEKAPSSSSNSNELLEELKKAGLSQLFQPMQDLGYFTVEGSICPTTNKPIYSPLSDITSENQILQYIDIDGKPPSMHRMDVISQSLPKRKENIDNPPIFDMQHFPFGQTGIASLHVASQRGVDIQSVDFCFGGSTLDMLVTKGAQGRNNSTFIATRVPGTKCIFVSNKSSHTKDLSNIGFQFERLVTGGRMKDVSDIKTAEHIHIMKVGGRQVLFRAEVDAIDDNNIPVEIKVSPKTWTTSVMLQMISSGSVILCKGTSANVSALTIPKRGGYQLGGKSKSQQKVITSAECLSLSEVVSLAFKYADVSVLERNILDAMNAMQNQLLDNNAMYKLNFLDDGSLNLEKLSSTEADEYNPFPSNDIVQRLIG